MRRTLLVVALLLVGCAGPDDDCTDCVKIVSDYERVSTQIPYDRARPSEHPAGGDSWTVMVYASADNDLESAIADDLRELLAVPTNSKFRIVVQADLSDRHGSELPIGTTPKWTSSKRFEVVGGALVEVADLGEVDSSSAPILTDFMVWASNEYPADRYAVVLLSHGYGWSKFGLDESHNSSFDIASLSQAFDQAIEQSDALREFALIGIDACVSASIEVATHLSPFGEYLLASQHNEPGHGWEYTAFDILADEPTMGPVQLAEHIADRFVARGVSDGEVELTLSLVDLYEMRALRAELSDFAIRLGTDQNTIFTRKLRQTRHFPNYLPNPTYLFDLEDLLVRLGAEDALGEDVVALRQALDNAVVFSTTGPQISAAGGLSIYAPLSSDEFELKYGNLEAFSTWTARLQNLYDWQSTFDLQFLDGFQRTEEGGETVIRGILVSGSEIATTAQTTLVSEQGRWLIELPTTINSEFVYARWDGRTLVDPDGTAVFGRHIGGDEYHVPVIQLRPDGSQDRLVMHQYSGGAVAFRRFGGTFGEFHVDPAAEFFPHEESTDPDLIRSQRRALTLAEVSSIRPTIYTGPTTLSVEMVVRGGNETEVLRGPF